jgi:hypothetical protein
MSQQIRGGATPMPDIDAIPPAYQDDVRELFRKWSAVRARNATLRTYIEMKAATKDLGISIPPDLTKVNTVVGWADKAVRVRVVRSKFQGFVFEGEQNRRLDMLARRNRLITKYSQACRGALTYGCSAITVMRGAGRRQPPVMVRSFSANQCCMSWDKDADGIGCGIAVVGVDRRGTASRYVLHEPDAVLTITRDARSGEWSCVVEPHPMGRPLMVPLIHDADDDRPLGHSAVTPEVMGIIDKAMRDVLRMEVGAEFFTAPQRYILGADPDLFGYDQVREAYNSLDDEYDDDADDDDDADEAPAPVDPHKMMRAYLGAFLALTRDSDGNLPQVGQFPAGDAKNFISVFENDAQRFSGATNVPLGQLGVLSNTYTSSDALGAANDPLILDVEQINASMGESMEEVARLMMALDRGVSYDELSDREMGVVAQFTDPAKPTISATADAWTKIGGADNSLIGTRVWYEGLGLQKATIDRIMAARDQTNSIALMNEIAQQLAQTQQSADANG